MAKTSGSNGGLPNGDSNYKGTVGKLEPLASIKNPKVYKTVKESISRFHSILGNMHPTRTSLQLPDLNIFLSYSQNRVKT